MDVVIEPAHFGPWNLAKGTKRVTVIHDLTPILFPEFHKRMSAVLQKMFLPGILKRTDLIIANSKNTKKDIHKVYADLNTEVKEIYPGVEEIFKPNIDESLLSELQITKPYFLFVGTLEPRKNLKVLIDAFLEFKKEDERDHSLVLVGAKGWRSKELHQMLGGLSKDKGVICTGYLPSQDLPSIYTNAAALVYPSKYEGFGFPVLEALSCGTPVIIADNSSLPEVGGDVAMYFNCDDVDQLLSHMRMTAINSNDNKAKYLDQAKKFSWDRFAGRMFDLLVKTS